MRVGIIGGGISGLTVAYYLQKLGIPYDLFESGEQAGGVMQTLHEKHYTLEMGPTHLHMTPELDEVIRDLKLENEVQYSELGDQDRYILKKGEYQKIPPINKALFKDNFFGLKTKLRLLKERSVSPVIAPNETVSQFFKRRFGKDLLYFSKNILGAGLLAADPDTMLVSRAFPELKNFELKYGSVIKGMLKEKNSDTIQSEVFSFKKGMQTLADSISSKLIALHTESTVEMVSRNKGKYIISAAPALGHSSGEYDALVLALPAYKAADILEFTSPGLSAALQNVAYPPLTVVHTAYQKKDMGMELLGLGAFHPEKEKQFTSGNTWNCAAYPTRCKDDEVLITSYIGGSKHPERALLPQEEILKKVHEELARNFKISAPEPSFQYIHTWKAALPHYNMFIEDVHHLAGMLEQDGIFVASNWLSGLTVSECIRRAKQVAQQLHKAAFKNAA